MKILQLQLQTGGKWNGIGSTSSTCCSSSSKQPRLHSLSLSSSSSISSFPAVSAVGLLAAAVVLSTPAPPEETLSNIPPTLSGETCDNANSKECQKGRIQRPKSRKAESCTTKCVGTCIRGGDGGPGEGPLNVRRPIIVFKQGFRSRQYCLVECSDICNLLDDVDKGR